jgi:hypothetical protein
MHNIIKASTQKHSKAMQNNHAQNRRKYNTSKQSDQNEDQNLSYDKKGNSAKGNKSGKIFSKKVQALDNGKEEL